MQHFYYLKSIIFFIFPLGLYIPIIKKMRKWHYESKMTLLKVTLFRSEVNYSIQGCLGKLYLAYCTQMGIFEIRDNGL